MADVNVRDVPDEVVERLRQQAGNEGVSLSEWVRRALAERAQLPTTAELADRRARLAAHAQPADEFAAYYRSRLRRR